MKILAPHPNCEPPEFKRIAITISVDSPFTTPLPKLDYGTAPQYVRQMLGMIIRGDLSTIRSFYKRTLNSAAHPKAYDYVVHKAEGVLKDVYPDASIECIVVGSSYQETDYLVELLKPRQVKVVSKEELSDLVAEMEQNFDCVCLVYPDALGHGFGRLERLLIKSSKNAVLVVNGRGRCFVLDAGTRRLLFFMRASERIYLPGILLNLGIILFTPPLIAYSLLSRLLAFRIAGKRSYGS